MSVPGVGILQVSGTVILTRNVLNYKYSYLDVKYAKKRLVKMQAIFLFVPFQPTCLKQCFLFSWGLCFPEGLIEGLWGLKELMRGCLRGMDCWCVPSTGSTWVCLKLSSSGICWGWSLSREGRCLQQCLVSVYEHGFEAHFPISHALLHVKSRSDAKRGAAFLRDET